MKWFENFVYSILNSKFSKALVIIITFLAFLGSIYMIAPSKIVLAKMLPGKSANTYSVYIDTPSGSSVAQTKAVAKCVIDILKQEKEVKDIELFLGMGAPLDYAGLVKGSGMKMSENVAEIVVNLTNKHHRSEKSFEMVSRLRPVIQQKCEPIVDKTNIKLIEQPAGPPTLASIVIELYGENQDSSRKLSQKLANILKETKGLVDVDIMQDEIYKKYELIINKEKLIKSGLSIKQINQILYLAFEGMQIAVKNSKNAPEQIPLFVILSKDTKMLKDQTKEAIEAKLASLNLMNQKGMMIPASEVVDVIRLIAIQQL